MCVIILHDCRHQFLCAAISRRPLPPYSLLLFLSLRQAPYTTPRGKGGKVPTCWSSAGRQRGVRLRAESPLPPLPFLADVCRAHRHTGATPTHRHTGFAGRRGSVCPCCCCKRPGGVYDCNADCPCCLLCRACLAAVCCYCVCPVVLALLLAVIVCLRAGARLKCIGCLAPAPGFCAALPSPCAWPAFFAQFA